MPLIDRYILWNLTVATGFVAATLTLAIWLSQLVKFLEIAVNGAVPMSLFLTLVGLALPNFLSITLPVSFLISLLFVYNKLIAESELVILRAAGFSPLRVARPALLMASGLTLLMLALTCELAPAAERHLQLQKQVARSQFSDLLLREGVFNKLGDDYTVYLRERGTGGDMHGLLLQDRSGERPVTIHAASGRLAEGPNGPRVLVFKGRRDEFDPATGALSSLSFDQYAVDLSLFSKQEDERWVEPSERGMIALLHPTDSAADQGHLQHFVAEFHTRIGRPFLVMGFTLIALFGLLGGEFDRRGLSRRILFVVAAVVLLEGAFLGVQSWARRSGAAIGVIYLLALAPPSVCAALLWRGPRRRRKMEAMA